MNVMVLICRINKNKIKYDFVCHRINVQQNNSNAYIDVYVWQLDTIGKLDQREEKENSRNLTFFTFSKKYFLFRWIHQGM